MPQAEYWGSESGQDWNILTLHSLEAKSETSMCWSLSEGSNVVAKLLVLHFSCSCFFAIDILMLWHLQWRLFWHYVAVTLSVALAVALEALVIAVADAVTVLAAAFAVAAFSAEG